jgi:hypothetical protein
MKIDVYDLCILCGFAALVAGLWWLAPPAALIIGGMLMGAFGFVGSAGTRGGTKK